MAEIGVIGAGSWGTALAVVLAHNGHHLREVQHIIWQSLSQRDS